MASPNFDWLTSRPDGVRLSVKVAPRAAKAGIHGIEVDARGQSFLAVRVAAPPEGGKANVATIKLLAEGCGVPASALSLVSGGRSRRKVVQIDGDAGLLSRRLKALVATG